MDKDNNDKPSKSVKNKNESYKAKLKKAIKKREKKRIMKH